MQIQNDYDKEVTAPWQTNVEPFQGALEAPQSVKGVKLEPVDFET